jgi:hypothetical protein
MAVAVFVAATPGKAQEPHYSRALSELRTARDYIEFDHRPLFGKERHHMVDEINKAIDEIKHAAWDDGKNTQFAPPAQGVTDPWAPMRVARRSLAEAHGHIAEGVDSPGNQGLRERALAHIHEAQITINAIIEANGQ